MWVEQPAAPWATFGNMDALSTQCVCFQVLMTVFSLVLLLLSAQVRAWLPRNTTHVSC